MRIVINRSVIAQALAEVAPFAPQKGAVLILKYAKVTTKGNRIKIEASDSNTTIRKYIEAVEIDQDGSFLIEVDTLMKFLSKVTGEAIELITDGSNLTVKHSKGSADLPIADANEYPQFDMPKDDVTVINLKGEILAECVANAKGFVGNDIIRPMMKPIYAYIKDAEFGYCATDTRALTHDRYSVDPNNTDINWYIEPSVFSIVAKLAKSMECVAITITPNAVSYKLGDTIVQTTQTKGRYPDFNRVIPKDYSMDCTVNRKELIDSINRVSMFAPDTRLIKFVISPMDITLSTDDIETMRRSAETIPHNGCSGELKIGLHSDILLTCLSICKEDDVRFKFTDPSRPVLICQDGKPNQVILQMPMTVN